MKKSHFFQCRRASMSAFVCVLVIVPLIFLTMPCKSSAQIIYPERKTFESPIYTWRISDVVPIYGEVGAVDLKYKVTVSALVTPYQDREVPGEFEVTINVNTWRANEWGTGYALVAAPFVTIGERKTNFPTRIKISDNDDTFGQGDYKLSAYDGDENNWGEVSFSLGPVGWTPPTQPFPWSLQDSQGRKAILMNQDGARAMYDGASIELKEFKISLADGGFEVGKISFYTDVYVGYWNLGGEHKFLGKLGTFDFTLNYLRGHRLFDPVPSMVTSDDNVQVGDTVAVEVKVWNPSTVVEVRSGQIIIDPASLGGKFRLIGSAVTGLGQVSPLTEVKRTFLLQAIEQGFAQPQATVKGKWGFPAEKREFDTSVSLGSDIEVQDAVTDVRENISDLLPSEFLLRQNYPNPFNPSTEIQFQLPKTSHVVLSIFNTLGKEIRTLVDAEYRGGYHSLQWDGKDNNGKAVSSGVYLYQLRAGDFTQVKKMSLLR